MHRDILCPALALALASGCVMGVGRYQPGRERWSLAGTSAGDSHRDAKAARAPEIGGGDTAMYAFDGAFYGGMKQGVSWAQQRDGSWSCATFFMDGHFHLLETLFDDRVTVGGGLFVAGYGTGESDSDTRYSTAGVETIAKVGLGGSVGVRGSVGLTYGRVTIGGPGEPARKGDLGGYRVAGGVDLVATRFGAADLALTVEGQYVRASGDDETGMATSFQGVALAFALVLAGF